MSIFSIDLPTFIAAAGYLGVAAIVFCETGVLFGFFLPGDSLLFTAGLVASQGVLSIWVLVPLVAVAAILGDSFGYYLGSRLGPALFTRDDSFFFRKKYIDETKHFYAKYGNRTIVLARFVPIVRTFAPLLAGVGAMPYATFLRYNVVGGVGWTAGLTLLGYFLGNTFPVVSQHLEVIVVGIVVLSLVPLALSFVRRGA